MVGLDEFEVIIDKCCFKYVLYTTGKSPIEVTINDMEKAYDNLNTTILLNTTFHEEINMVFNKLGFIEFEDRLKYVDSVRNIALHN